MLKNRLIAYSELLISAVIVGSSVAAGKLTLLRMPVFLSQAASLAVALVVLVPLILANPQTHPIRIGKKDVLILLVQAFLGMFLFRVLMLFGLHYASAVQVGIVTSITPAAIAFLSFVLLKERITRRLLLGILCSMLGVISIQAPSLLIPASAAAASSGHSSYIGILFVALAVIGEAMLTILRKKTSDRVTSLLGTVYVTLFSFVMFCPLPSWRLGYSTFPK